MKYKMMCDCRKAFNAAGKAAAGDKYRRTVMVETASKDGETCDYCGYYIFKDYGNPREAAVKSEGTARKKATTITEWHKQDD